MNTASTDKARTMADVIKSVVAEYFPEEGAMGAAFGGCGDFADYCHGEAEDFGIKTEFESVYMTFQECNCLIYPPAGTTIEQLGDWGVIKNISHVWLIHENRHYDAVTPEGVDNPFDLRLFRQVCIEVLSRDFPEELEKLKAQHAWWVESARLTEEFLAWDATRRQ
jgi:hypothetical protein